MPQQQIVTLQQALDAVEALPGPQQDDLVEIIRHRRHEQRRNAFASRVQEAKEAYARDEVRRGTVTDFMSEITE